MQISYVHLVSVGSAALSTTRMKNGNIELELSGWLGDWMWSQPGVKLKVL